MSRTAWDAMRGYPEFEAFSFNIDSIGLMQAHYGGLLTVDLLAPSRAFHLEHSIGSGWTPEGEKKLFARLNQKKILNPDWRFLDPLVNKLRSADGLITMNYASWGMGSFDLPEEPLLAGEFFPSPVHPRKGGNWPDAPVGALKPEFDLDRLAYWEERRRRLTNADESAAHIVQLFWPGDDGIYSEQKSISIVDAPRQRRRFVLRTPKCDAGSVLRLDPTYRAGIIDIHRLELTCALSGKITWRAVRGQAGQVSGTAMELSIDDEADTVLRLESVGDDPQIILPAVKDEAKLGLLLTVEMSFIPQHES
ncbi:hypothetical protein MASR2M8_17760 [Opitutaceae bacterium]